MALKDATPDDDRDALAKQFRALRNVAVSLEARLSHYEGIKFAAHRAESELQGERATNEMLTNRIEALEAAIDVVLWYDQSDADQDYKDAIEALRMARHT